MKSVKTLEQDLKNLLLNYKGTYQQRRRYAMLKDQLHTAKEREARHVEPESQGPHLLADLSWMRS